MRERVGEVHVIGTAKVDRGVFGDDAFVESSERNGKLDGGAGLGAAATVPVSG